MVGSILVSFCSEVAFASGLQLAIHQLHPAECEGRQEALNTCLPILVINPVPLEPPSPPSSHPCASTVGSRTAGREFQEEKYEAERRSLLTFAQRVIG